MAQPPVIEMKSMVKQRDTLTIGPLNFEIPQGCVTAIVGMNGSGKSTLMGALMGFIHLDQGEMHIEGERYNIEDDATWKQKIGYVPELPNSEDDDQTPDELATLGAYWYNNWDWNLYHKLMAKYEISPRMKLSKMSKGMRRKFEIILILSYRPDLLLLDEPTSGLDPISWKLLIEDLQQVMEDGKHTIIIATHVIEEVKRLADYILFMHKGQLLVWAEKDELFDAWKEYWIEGLDAGDLKGAPGVSWAEQEWKVTRVISNDPIQLEGYFRDHGIHPTRIQSMPLDEIMIHMIRMEDERRGRL
ncbi:ATP-binding cassette domain-containing protein [Paenibacillus taiwanensis]|uniref:ATP-binding cassette domain-containing protein n=1 Tax=Paenibacillus taiwanensis TaxID=401638 RepID=UPI00040A9A62|nr:ABC transporter ATP-binding protein [Paenibacillus taiwanensis]